MAHARRVPSERMSRLTLNTTDAHGHPIQVAAGYDPGLAVYFLDVFDLLDDEADPRYESMFAHPAGLTTYGLPDLTADVERLTGRPLPTLIDAVQSAPSGQFIRHLGTH